MRQKIDRSCEGSTEQKERDGSQKRTHILSAFCLKSAGKSHKDQDKVPQKPVNRHQPVMVHQSAGFKESHDPAQKAVVLDKDRKNRAEPGDRVGSGKKKSQVHGNAAQLKRKIPPVIGMVIFHKI